MANLEPFYWMMISPFACEGDAGVYLHSYLLFSVPARQRILMEFYQGGRVMIYTCLILLLLHAMGVPGRWFIPSGAARLI